MNNEIALYQYDAAPVAISKIPRTGDYSISAYGNSATLRRGVDFGMIRRQDGDSITKSPTLFKSGAEKVAVTYGLCQRYAIESKIEDIESGFFFYAVRCDLVKIVNGAEYVITSAYGSANTRERRTGSQSPYDGANSAIKMAQKRALVSAALSLGCMSDSFTQDIESETEEASVYKIDPSKPLTSQQVTFLYASAGRAGMSKQEAKEHLAKFGYKSAKDVLQGDLDKIIDAMSKGEN